MTQSKINTVTISVEELEPGMAWLNAEEGEFNVTSVYHHEHTIEVHGWTKPKPDLYADGAGKSWNTLWLMRGTLVSVKNIPTGDKSP